MCCLAGGRCAVHATWHCTPSSGPARRLHPPHHFHLPELLYWHSGPGCAAQRHAGARGAAMPAIVAKEGTPTWLPVLAWLPGQLLDPSLPTLILVSLNLPHMSDFQCTALLLHMSHSVCQYRFITCTVSCACGGLAAITSCYLTALHTTLVCKACCISQQQEPNPGNIQHQSWRILIAWSQSRTQRKSAGDETLAAP